MQAKRHIYLLECIRRLKIDPKMGKNEFTTPWVIGKSLRVNYPMFMTAEDIWKLRYIQEEYTFN